MSQRLPGERMKGLITLNDCGMYSLALCESIGMRTGSQIVTIVTVDGTLITGGITPNIHLTRTRYIVLKNGSLRVEGV